MPRRNLSASVLLLALAAGLLPPLLAPPAARAAIPVIDPANLAQNLRTALATLRAIGQRVEMIRHQIDQLRILAQDIQDLRNPSFREVARLLGELELEMRRTRGLVYSLRDLSPRFEETYPGFAAAADLEEDDFRRADTTLETLRAALVATQRMAEDTFPSQFELARMKAQAIGSEGNLQVLQSQALLTSYVGEEVSKLLEEVAVQTNLQAVWYAHELSSRASAEATFAEAVRRARVGAPAYEAVAPIPVVPAGYPRTLLGFGRKE